MPAKLISKKRAFEGYFTLDVVEIAPKSLRHGGYAERRNREIFTIGPVVSVLLYNPRSDEVLLVQQFRTGAFISGEKDPFLFECVAGRIDGDEAREDAVRREAMEETGCAITKLEYIGQFYPSPSALDETFFIYAGCVEEMTPGIHGLEEEGEEIKTHCLPADEALAMLDRNVVRNGMSAMILHWFARNRARLRKEWGKA